jgi:hypothetical protein
VHLSLPPGDRGEVSQAADSETMGIHVQNTW